MTDRDDIDDLLDCQRHQKQIELDDLKREYRRHHDHWETSLLGDGPTNVLARREMERVGTAIEKLKRGIER